MSKNIVYKEKIITLGIRITFVTVIVLLVASVLAIHNNKYSYVAITFYEKTSSSSHALVKEIETAINQAGLEHDITIQKEKGIVYLYPTYRSFSNFLSTCYQLAFSAVQNQTSQNCCTIYVYEGY
ncbi:hypothetical protein ACG2LH_12130 [Zhouia sp. PK063]|uniref:hypothetical protein n=1 Tax=Zhouia sp. PK063 TaxID=3373602 RepID=UPI0037BB173E